MHSLKVLWWEVKVLARCRPDSLAWWVANSDLGELLWLSYITCAFGMVIIAVACSR